MTIQYGILHNRKTAGTALKEVIYQQKQRTPRMSMQCFEHDMTFPRFVQTYPDAKAIFFIRDPISRFISGFYSRMREGKPRYHYPWSAGERRAFKRFQHPNELAEALSSWNIVKRYAAYAAMNAIGHVRHRYTAFLGTRAFLASAVERIAFIGHQPDFEADLARLRKLLQIDEDILAPQDAVRAHRNPDVADKQLSSIAVANLQKWYRQDIEIYKWCLEKREALIFG